ncbi:hypothetical protein [Nostoc favosum]|uniref:Uncharacterized protein n=1 Tax=Nostoc favosum CHAB5714 TaxID=2780399 RepID=A0ABS8I5I0_9NOSO|nr:hypothetical protein [Nostoc favosum]MCC5599059.1 hypothetical protein [Nostoc favosum CHAB5714]
MIVHLKAAIRLPHQKRSHARYQIQLTAKIRKITPSLVSSAQNRCLVRRWSNDDAKRSHTPPKTI